MFAIRLLPPSTRGGDGERLGQITIGRFTEMFGCHPARGQSVRSMASRWRAQLRRLVGGDEPAVALDTGGAAWILYRVGKRCYMAIAFLALMALRCEGGESNGSALEVTGKRGGTDRQVWEQVESIVSSVAREHRLSLGPVNRNRPDYLLNEKMYYGYYPSSSRTNISFTCRRELRRPIEVEITESGVSRPSRAHLALLRDLRERLSMGGLLVKRGEPRTIVTD